MPTKAQNFRLMKKYDIENYLPEELDKSFEELFKL